MTFVLGKGFIKNYPKKELHKRVWVARFERGLGWGTAPDPVTV